jgi:hypothetical protein
MIIWFIWVLADFFVFHFGCKDANVLLWLGHVILTAEAMYYIISFFLFMIVFTYTIADNCIKDS